MAKHAYQSFRFQAATLKQIAVINAIIEDLMGQGYTLSLRQLYYQLVSKNIITNEERSYKQLGELVNKARLAGMIDWSAIEDRNRDVVQRSHWTSGGSIIQACATSYHMDMWENQKHRVFAIVEKAALAGVLQRICHRFDVPMLAARGYPSVSIMRELVRDYILPAVNSGQTVTVLHLGDHDPSGLDMTRDLVDRIQLFMEDMGRVNLQRIALTMPQIEDQQPPPNPAKTTDSRYEAYMREYGHESWELDALQPAFLSDLVQGHVEDHIDEDAWEVRKSEIRVIKDKLQRVANEFDDDDDDGEVDA